MTDFSGPTRSEINQRFARRGITIGGRGIFAIAVVGLALLLTACGGNDETSSDSDGSSSSSSSSSGGSAATTTEPTECELLRREPLVLEVSSADIPGGLIPEQYLASNGYDNGFPTPRLAWSAVPEKTTEIVILIMRFEDDKFAALQSDPNPRGAAIRTATERWVLSGLDRSLTSLPNTSLTVPPPVGAIQQDNQLLDGCVLRVRVRLTGMDVVHPGQFEVRVCARGHQKYRPVIAASCLEAASTSASLGAGPSWQLRKAEPWCSPFV